MTKRLYAYLVALFLAAAGWLQAQTPRAAEEKLVMTQPARDGMTAACRATIEGRATLDPGEHVWVFAARKNFADLGLVWLQGEADVDQATREFSFPVILGIPEDIGFNFRVSIAVLDEATHNRMKAKLLEMMTNNRHLPVPFPPTIGAPKHRIVRKVSHDGC
jgi:hypothetical protein